ncbi:MAG: terpene cyclase/mutase family protein [Planctomycetota bacterium]|nr:terpene cyclase/mutase family protein [Planctomycetota bacterium]MDA1211452.1 terpene cyclase/mutase family protein [Planctomycetota bacterium]
MLCMMSLSYGHQKSFRRISGARILAGMLAPLLLSGGFFVTLANLVSAQEESIGPSAKALQKSRQSAIEFLKNSQGDDGSWTSSQAPGITALVAYSLLESGVSVDDPAVRNAFDHLKSYQQDDGGIYYAESSHKNYETCISLMAFKAANADGRFDDLLAGAEKFLRGLQWDEGEGIEDSDTFFGGAGYGGHKRPDLSNTQFLVEALKQAGAGEDDPAIQKALLFVSRTQNLETEFNTTEFAAKVNDGGFYYTPAAGGTSQAGLTDNGGLRSYASMTYAGLKSMIYAGLSQDDPRVKAAREWIARQYTVDENPGMGQQGLLYYYHTFAKTLSVLGVDQFEDAEGNQHDWRKDLAEKLFSLQQENGSWVNPAERWGEGDPHLATAYVLLALSHCDMTAP